MTFVKDVYLFCWQATIGQTRRVLDCIIRRQRLVVLTYHRVSDDYQDSLTVSVQQFREQCQHLTKNYQVLPLQDALAHKQFTRSKPLVAITFDDGYACNFLSAAPILKEFHLPATFFVSTGFIGTNRMFEHDKKLYKEPIPVMTWDHVCQLQRQGFELGSHTVNHLRCSELDDEEFSFEIARSKAELEDRTSSKVRHFAYPYGGMRDIRSEQKVLLAQQGYESCLSAYGALNVCPVDAFDVRRYGVDYKFSMRAFNARLHGYTLREEPR